MLVGYNTNITFKGKVYHVQTEDSGTKNPVIITHLYIQGIILSSKKTNYADIAATPDFKEKVRELMKEQHKSMLKELISGKHTGDSAELPQAALPETGQEIRPEPAVIAEAKAAEKPQPGPADKPKEKPADRPSGQPASRPAAKPADEKAEGKSQIDKSLDDILLDYILKREE